MDGPQDLGGKPGFGPVVPEPDEPVFHAPWEKRAFALTLAMGFTGTWNIDASRHARERIPPADYLSIGYYRIWLEGLCTLLKENGLADADEIASGHSSGPARQVKRLLKGADVAATLASGGPVEREAPAPARFAVGDTVRTLAHGVTHHTRLPAYVRGQTGTIAHVHGCHVFPDTNAHGQGECPAWLYGVVFDAAAVFGPSRAGDSLHLDLWEPYLEPA